MFSIDPRERFLKNDDYIEIEESKKYYIMNRETAARVEVDKLGKKIFQKFPSNLQDIREALEKEDGIIIPEKLLSHYVQIFFKGDLIKKEIAEIPDAGKLPQIQNESGQKVGVMIVTYNGQNHIRRNLDSLLKQTVLPDEIVVVDNRSSDQTVQILEEYEQKLKLIRNRRNYHYARAVNIGVREMSSDIIVVLNQDIETDLRFLEKIMTAYQALSSKKDVAALVPQMRFLKLKGFINSMGNVIRNRGWGSDNYFCAVDIGQLNKLKYVKSSCFGAIAITREGWERVGLLDEKYGSYYEDVDWCFRAHLEKMSLVAAPQALVYHHFGGSYEPGRRLRFVVKNRLRLVLKNFSGRIMLGFIKNYLLEDIRNLTALLKRGRIPEVILYLSAYAGLMVTIPEMISRHLKKRAASREQIELFFRQNQETVILSNEQLQPVINKGVIRSYYYFA